jgi:DNA-directed RNA polymerase specialized sigma subunit
LKENEKKHTLSEIAELLDTSMSVITSIERRALKKMKSKLAKLIKK